MNELAINGEHAVKTGMLPDHIKTGWQFAVIAATGQELGMQPMRAIRSLSMVKGKVMESADSQLARFKAAGGRSEFEVLDETKAVLHLVHPNGDKHKETFSLEDAKRAGLASNSNYSKFPKAMLRSRAITAGLKSIGWEGAVGAYDPDELRSDESNEPAKEPIAYRPKGTKSQDVGAGITVHHVDSFEPPATHKPQIHTDERGVVRLKTQRKAPEITDPVGKARLAVSKAQTLDDCNTLRDLITTRHNEGVFTDADRDELVKLLHHRAEMLIESEDKGTDFPHEAAQHEVAHG
jgi:hypothetical protein